MFTFKSFPFIKHKIWTSLCLISFSISPASAEVFAAKDSPLAPQTDVALALVTDATKTDISKRLKDYEGHTLLVDFWASWCGPCRASFPWMNKMQAKYKDENFKVVAINLDVRPELAYAFLEQIPAEFDVLLDEQAKLPDAYNVIGMPTSYLIDKEGRLRAQHIGFHDSKLDEYEAGIKTLLAE